MKENMCNVSFSRGFFCISASSILSAAVIVSQPDSPLPFIHTSLGYLLLRPGQIPPATSGRLVSTENEMGPSSEHQALSGFRFDGTERNLHGVVSVKLRFAFSHH